MCPIFLILICCYCCTTTNAQGAANMVIEKFYYCKSLKNQKVNMSIVPKTFEPRTQILDVTLITPIPLGNELRFGIDAEMEISLTSKTHWQHLFSAEDDYCRTIQIYLGEMFYQLETAWGVQRGACPIPRGHYHAVNYTNDYSRMKLQTFPFGRLRITLHVLDKPARNELLCTVMIIANKA